MPTVTLYEEVGVNFWNDFNQALTYAKQGKFEQFLSALSAVESAIPIADGGNEGRLRLCRKARETYSAERVQGPLVARPSASVSGAPAGENRENPPLAARPTVVIVTPAYNAARFIDDTIASVVGQRGPFLLVYHVQDGGSTDGTVDILQSWSERLQDGRLPGAAEVRFSWRSEPDEGMYDAIALGFEHAYAALNDAEAAAVSVMTWINADDLFAMNALHTVCSYFTEQPAASWVTGMGALMNESGAAVRVFTEPDGFSQLDLAGGLHDGRALAFVQQEGTFWRHSLWQQSGGISRSLRLAGDWDLWRRFALSAPLTKIHTVLGLHRRHAGQLSADVSSYHAELDAVTPLVLPPAGLSDSGLKAVYDPVVSRWNVWDVPSAQSHMQAMLLAQAKVPGPGVVVASARLCASLPPTLPGGRPWPKISVVTPSFNQGRYIAETIESVISQDYPFVEHIIIDGGSTDETMAVVERYRKQLAHVVSEKDGGQSDALNKGFKRATGDIFCWLNSDDQFAPGALAAVAMAFATSGSDMVSGICEVYQDGQLVQRHMSACEDGPLPLQDLLDLDSGWNAGQFFYQPEVFFTRALWEKAGAHVREDCFYSMDYELWCRFAAAAANLHVIGSPLARFRMHREQKTADPAKFKAELLCVRERFLAERSMLLHRSERPAAQWDRVLRVAMVNDIGPRFGAGIAHHRLAASIDMAGHDVALFELAAKTRLRGQLDEQSLIADVLAFQPDLVIFGNLHAATRDSVAILQALGEKFPTFWVTHDFWLFTGRCGYPGPCTKYLAGCDATCPTPTAYPELEPGKIAAAWQRKRRLLDSPQAPIVLGNSRWSRDIATRALAPGAARDDSREAQVVVLGAPANVFKPVQRSASRAELGIGEEQFVIAFSVSAMSDERKGGKYLLAALEGANLQNLTVLVIGTMDTAFEVTGANVLALGYVSDSRSLVAGLSAANVYIGPSLEETFGQVFVEAALVGTPSIGFDQTGVADAITDGVTGLRVACSAEGLRDAILRLYHDRDLCDSLGAWASIHAASEFSLESSYRSLFNVWRRCGLVDKWKLPHKTGFVRQSRFIDEVQGAATIWRGAEGVSTLEGPYLPDIPHTFRWCCGPVTRLTVNCAGGGAHRVRFVYLSNLFDELKADTQANGVPTGLIHFFRTKPGEPKHAEITFKAKPGWNEIQLMPDGSRTPSPEEPRALTFMLQDVEVAQQ